MVPNKSKKILSLVTLILLGLAFPTYLLCHSFARPSESHLKEDSWLEKSNIVFYQKDKTVLTALKKELSQQKIPTLYLDFQSSDGQRLASRFDVDKAETIVMCRDGAITQECYTVEQDGTITLNQEVIEKASH
ncbi:hypothetical protein SAMN04487839_12311 [Streptococcus gallolyticus]|uniref:Uncharacterized protein n=1 Tax=Streptococcus gallolyticus TaxID=315405 RepID=A0A1H7XZU9_9STRE|nr:hypothetical protein SAMN02910295_0242 [Streptococcus gallolyticus]SEM39486.1 hypothetical protein SAMN04487839_12311 [Streptococcus gallolyticus]